MPLLQIDFPAEQLLQWIAKAKGQPLKFAVEFLQDMNEQVVYATPYVTGNLMGSWYAGLNGEPDAREGPPDSGGATVGRLNLVLAELQIGDIYYAVNGAVYAARVEYGFTGPDSLGRVFNQAPRFFVRGTLDRAASIAEATAQRIADE